MPPIEIYPPHIVKEDGWIRASYAVRGVGGGRSEDASSSRGDTNDCGRPGGLSSGVGSAPRPPSHLTLEVTEPYDSFVDDSCDAAVVALLPVAMKEGKKIEVHGPLSAALEWRLRHTAVPVLMRLIPDLQSISVEANDLVTRRERPDGALITGLSCGVDSLVACQDYLLEPKVPEADQITHFLFTEIGSHGDGPGAHTFIEPRWKHVSAAAAAMDRPIIRVRSNMGGFYRTHTGLGFEQTMTPRAAAVALFLQRGVRRYLLASGQPWEEVKVDPWPGTGPVDPILMAAFSTAACEQTVVGLEYARVEKTGIVSGMPVAKQFLNVCTMRGDSNCGYCKKCLRTALTLEILGKLQDFSGVFDLGAYGRYRTRYLGEVMVGTGLFIPEIRDLMQKNGFKIPAASGIDRRARQLWEWVPEGFRKMVRPAAGVFRR